MQFSVHTSTCYKSRTDEFTTALLPTGYAGKVKRLFYVTVHSLMKDQ